MHFEDMIFEQHVMKLKSTKDDLEDKELIHSYHGFHYKRCPSSDVDASEKPDTCQCHNTMLKYCKLNKRIFDL